jgi:hypothetical protein
LRAFIVTPTFEPALIAELGEGCRPRAGVPPGVVIDDGDPAGTAAEPTDAIFARQILPDATLVEAPSVKPLAEGAYRAVEAAIDAGTGAFTVHAFAPPPPPATDDDARGNGGSQPERAATATDDGVGSRVTLIGRQLLDLLRERRRRAFRRYQPPEAFDGRGLLVQLLALDRRRVVVSVAHPRPLAHGGTDLAPWPGGDAPVAIDRRPPSRAYRKLEEAFLWMGAAPAEGQTVVDLGGSPGGWAYSALRRGARVTAVDRAPLAPPAAGHPGLTALIGNAFTFEPVDCVDWLTCDVICEPARSLALIERWVGKRWCRNLVVTVKFKGRDGYAVLSGVHPILARAGWRFARVKQLAHNKNEVTVMGREVIESQE